MFPTIEEMNSLRASVSLFHNEIKSTRKDIKDMFMTCATLDRMYKTLEERIVTLEKTLNINHN